MARAPFRIRVPSAEDKVLENCVLDSIDVRKYILSALRHALTKELSVLRRIASDGGIPSSSDCSSGLLRPIFAILVIEYLGASGRDAEFLY